MSSVRRVVWLVGAGRGRRGARGVSSSAAFDEGVPGWVVGAVGWGAGVG